MREMKRTQLNSLPNYGGSQPVDNWQRLGFAVGHVIGWVLMLGLVLGSLALITFATLATFGLWAR